MKLKWISSYLLDATTSLKVLDHFILIIRMRISCALR